MNLMKIVNCYNFVFFSVNGSEGDLTSHLLHKKSFFVASRGHVFNQVTLACTVRTMLDFI